MSAAAANLKEKRDMSTEATGAFFGGALVGIRRTHHFSEKDNST